MFATLQYFGELIGDYITEFITFFSLLKDYNRKFQHEQTKKEINKKNVD